MNISVIGGGIAGIAAALACARRGANVTVFEQAKELSEVGAGLQIGPNGVAVLKALGVGAAAQVAAATPQSVEMRDLHSGRIRAQIPMGPAALARWGNPYWQFHRADLLGVLTEAAEKAGVKIQLGAKVSDPDADIVIAADGVKSGTRKRLFGGTPEFTGQVAWRGLIPLTKPSRDPTRVWMGKGCHVVCYPLRGGNLMNVAAFTEQADWAEEGWSIPTDPAGLRTAFADACPELQGILAQIEETFLWGLFVHPALDTWVKGNTVLVGDAAHPMLPYLAQGAGMGLEDAWVLAELLSQFGVSGLSQFETLRMPRTRMVQQKSARNRNIYHATGLRRVVLQSGIAGMSALAPKLLLKQLDWLYGVDVTS